MSFGRRMLPRIFARILSNQAASARARAAAAIACWRAAASRRSASRRCSSMARCSCASCSFSRFLKSTSFFGAGFGSGLGFGFGALTAMSGFCTGTGSGSSFGGGGLGASSTGAGAGGASHSSTTTVSGGWLCQRTPRNITAARNRCTSAARTNAGRSAGSRRSPKARASALTAWYSPAGRPSAPPAGAARPSPPAPIHSARSCRRRSAPAGRRLWILPFL